MDPESAERESRDSSPRWGEHDEPTSGGGAYGKEAPTGSFGADAPTASSGEASAPSAFDPLGEARTALGEASLTLTSWADGHRTELRLGALAAITVGAWYLVGSGHIPGVWRATSLLQLVPSRVGPRAPRLPVALRSVRREGEAVRLEAAHFPLSARVGAWRAGATPAAFAAATESRGETLELYLAGALRVTDDGMALLERARHEGRLATARAVGIVRRGDQDWTRIDREPVAGLLESGDDVPSDADRIAGDAAGRKRGWRGVWSRLTNRWKRDDGGEAGESGGGGAQGAGAAAATTPAASTASSNTIARLESAASSARVSSASDKATVSSPSPSSSSAVSGSSGGDQRAPLSSSASSAISEDASSSWYHDDPMPSFAPIPPPLLENTPMAFAQLYIVDPRQGFFARLTQPGRVDAAQLLIREGMAAAMDPIDGEWVGLDHAQAEVLWTLEALAQEAQRGMWEEPVPRLRDVAKSFIARAWSRRRKKRDEREVAKTTSERVEAGAKPKTAATELNGTAQALWVADPKRDAAGDASATNASDDGRSGDAAPVTAALNARQPLPAVDESTQAEVFGRHSAKLSPMPAAETLKDPAKTEDGARPLVDGAKTEDDAQQLVDEAKTNGDAQPLADSAKTNGDARPLADSAKTEAAAEPPHAAAAGSESNSAPAGPTSVQASVPSSSSLDVSTVKATAVDGTVAKPSFLRSAGRLLGRVASLGSAAMVQTSAAAATAAKNASLTAVEETGRSARQAGDLVRKSLSDAAGQVELRTTEAAARARGAVVDATTRATEVASTAASDAVDSATEAAQRAREATARAVADTAADVARSVAEAKRAAVQSAARTASSLSTSAQEALSKTASSATNAAAETLSDAKETAANAASTASEAASSVARRARDRAAASATATAAKARARWNSLFSRSEDK